MQNILELSIHQLAEKSGLSEIRLPKGSNARLLRTRLPQVGKPSKDVRELLMLQYAKQRHEVLLIKPPLLAPWWLGWLLLPLVLPLREMRNDSLDEFILVSANRRIGFAADVLESAQSDGAQDHAWLDSLEEHSLESNLLGS